MALGVRFMAWCSISTGRAMPRWMKKNVVPAIAAMRMKSNRKPCAVLMPCNWRTSGKAKISRTAKLTGMTPTATKAAIALPRRRAPVGVRI
jgi:hypothetical protein